MIGKHTTRLLRGTAIVVVAVLGASLGFRVPAAQATEHVPCVEGDRSQVQIWYQFDAFLFCAAFRATPDNGGFMINPPIENPHHLIPGDNSGYFRAGPTDTIFYFRPVNYIPLTVKEIREIKVDYIV